MLLTIISTVSTIYTSNVSWLSADLVSQIFVNVSNLNPIALPVQEYSAFGRQILILLSFSLYGKFQRVIMAECISNYHENPKSRYHFDIFNALTSFTKIKVVSES